MRLAGYAFLAGASALLTSPAIGQQIPGATGLQRHPIGAPGNAVYERDRPAFDAKGMVAGAFRFYPSVTVGSYYDSNVFASDTSEVDDFVGFVGPQLAVMTEQDALTLDARLGVGISRYLDRTDQNAEEAEGFVGGRYRLSTTDSLRAGLALRRQVVGRDDVDDGGGAGAPRMVHRATADAGYSAVRGAFAIDVGGRATDQDFRLDTQRGSDRREYDGTGRLGYRATRELTPFVEPFFQVRDFDTSVDSGGFQRDANRVGGRVGTLYTLGDTLSLEASAGLSRWEFDDPAFGDDTGWMARGTMGWNVTPVTTIKASLGRDEIATTRVGSSLREVIGTNVGVEHAIQPDILVFADAEYRMVDFNGPARDDDVVQFAVGGDYLLTQMFSVGASYLFANRESTAVGEDFTRNIVWVNLRAQF